jgi:hypothetical protein
LGTPTRQIVCERRPPMLNEPGQPSVPQSPLRTTHGREVSGRGGPRPGVRAAQMT